MSRLKLALMPNITLEAGIRLAVKYTIFFKELLLQKHQAKEICSENGSLSKGRIQPFKVTFRIVIFDG